MRSSRTLSQVLGPNSPPPQTQASAQAPSSKRKYAAMHNPHIASYKLCADDVNRVIHSLALPDREIIAAREHSNDAASATHFGGVQAYAKLAGRDWTFYVKALEVSIGRASEVGDMAPSQVDLDLGPAKVISRLHAKIEYDLQDRYWKCSVVGRNGLKVDGRLFKDRKVARLSSGQVLEVGGVQMMFVLPDSPPEVQATFLPDALREELEAPLQEPVMPIIPLPVLATTTAPTTPGPMTGDVDYAAEDARELKPPFSYATLISQAILSSPDRTLTLAQIYSWISAHYSWYRFAKSGWQNSIRHNLSLNKAFVKVPRKAEEPGKGMKWTIQEEFVDEFLNKSKRPAAQGGSRGSSVKRRRKEEAPSQTPPPQQQHQHQHDQNHQNHQMHQEERMHVHAQAQAQDQQQLRQHPQQNQSQVMPEVQHVQHVQAAVPTPDLPAAMQQQAPPEPQPMRTPLLPAAQLDTKTAERTNRIMSTPPSLPPSARQQQPLSSPAPFWKYMVSNMTTPTGTTHAHLLPSPGAAGRFSPGAALHASVEFANDLGRLTNLHGQTPLRPTSSERQSMSRQEGLPSPHLNGKAALHGHDETTNGALQVLPTAATTSAAVNAATGIEQLFDLEGVDLRKGFPEISRWSEGREGEAALYSF